MEATGSRVIGFQLVMAWSLLGLISYAFALRAAFREARNEKAAMRQISNKVPSSDDISKVVTSLSHTEMSNPIGAESSSSSKSESDDNEGEAPSPSLKINGLVRSASCATEDSDKLSAPDDKRPPPVKRVATTPFRMSPSTSFTDSPKAGARLSRSLTMHGMTNPNQPYPTSPLQMSQTDVYMYQGQNSMMMSLAPLSDIITRRMSMSRSSSRQSSQRASPSSLAASPMDGGHYLVDSHLHMGPDMLNGRKTLLQLEPMPELDLKVAGNGAEKEKPQEEEKKKQNHYPQ